MLVQNVIIERLLKLLKPNFELFIVILIALLCPDVSEILWEKFLGLFVLDVPTMAHLNFSWNILDPVGEVVEMRGEEAQLV